MNDTQDDNMRVQDLRTEAHRFFAELKHELGALEDDLTILDRELATLNVMRDKVAHDIEEIEEKAIEHMDAELVGLLNEADEENEFEMGMG